MGLCRFFQQGSCRYGTKCHNEHFDVKVFLKADMESAINGKMWPFSAYGPFKDKANFPNFIEDQSFEEMRFMCYEAKRQNNFEQFHQQFNREVLEATNKMKTMLQMAPQILDTMIKIYESPEGASVSSVPQQSNNPFAAAAPATNASTSIFGKPTLTAGNIFGAATGQVNNSNSIFGGSMATGNTGIFGGPAATPAPNVFGQPQQQQQPPQPTAQAFQGGNIFGQAPVQVQAQTVNPSPFGGFPQAGGMFGQATNLSSGGLFGQAAAQQQQQQQTQQPPSGLFSQAAGFPNQQQQIQQQQQQQQQQLQMQQQQQQQQLMMQQQQMLQQQEHQQLQQQQQQQQAASAAPPLAYSSMDELTADEIEAFKSDQFLPGHLPFKPPPRELC